MPGDWTATRVPYADIEIPAGVSTYVEVRQVDAAGNRGATRAIVITGTSIEEILVPRGRSVTIDIEEEAQKILRSANWAKFEKEVYEASRKAAVSGGFAVTAATAGKAVLKTVGGTVASTFGFLVFVPSTGCAMTYPVPPDGKTGHQVFRHRIGIAARAVSAGFRAKPGATNAAKSLIDTAQERLTDLDSAMQTHIDGLKGDECKVTPRSFQTGARVAVAVLKEVEQHVNETATKPVPEKKRPAKKAPTKERNKKKRCNEKEAEEKKFSKSYYRYNLCWLTQDTGYRPGDKPGKPSAIAHHVLPQHFDGRFAKAGLNVHVHKYMCWMNRRQHELGTKEFDDNWRDWWDQRNRLGRVADTPRWRKLILRQARAFSGPGKNECRFPPTRGADRPKRPWNVDAGQEADYQP